MLVAYFFAKEITQKRASLELLSAESRVYRKARLYEQDIIKRSFKLILQVQGTLKKHRFSSQGWLHQSSESTGYFNSFNRTQKNISDKKDRVIIIISIVEGRDEGEGLVGREVCIWVMPEVVLHVEDDILTDSNSTVGILG